MASILRAVAGSASVSISTPTPTLPLSLAMLLLLHLYTPKHNERSIISFKTGAGSGLTQYMYSWVKALSRAERERRDGSVEIMYFTFSSSFADDVVVIAVPAGDLGDGDGKNCTHS